MTYRRLSPRPAVVLLLVAALLSADTPAGTEPARRCRHVHRQTGMQRRTSSDKGHGLKRRNASRTGRRTLRVRRPAGPRPAGSAWSRAWRSAWSSGGCGRSRWSTGSHEEW